MASLRIAPGGVFPLGFFVFFSDFLLLASCLWFGFLLVLSGFWRFFFFGLGFSHRLLSQFLSSSSPAVFSTFMFMYVCMYVCSLCILCLYVCLYSSNIMGGSPPPPLPPTPLLLFLLCRDYRTPTLPFRFSDADRFAPLNHHFSTISNPQPRATL